MKKTTSLIVSLLIVGAMFGLANQTDLQKQKLNGKVKSVSDEESNNYFNTAGNYESRSYDDGYYYAGDVHYAYNDKDQIISLEDEDYYDGLVYGEYYTYNDAGLLTEIKYKNYSNETTTKFEYNDKKQQIWKKNYEYDVTSKLVSATEYAYDKDGIKIKESQYDQDMTLLEYTEYRYDKAKNLIENSVYMPNKVLRDKTLDSYDSMNRLIEETFYQGENFKHKIKLSYDDHNNETTKITSYSDATVTTLTYTYTYDKMGNWLTKESMEEGKPFDKLSRKIKYYEE